MLVGFSAFAFLILIEKDLFPVCLGREPNGHPNGPAEDGHSFHEGEVMSGRKKISIRHTSNMETMSKTRT